MLAPPTPDDEAQRLATLRRLNILDTEPEERFDRLTRLARHLFRTPIALVSLIDQDRQWFKSCVGLEATETPRDISFCGHAILGSGIFLIPDARQDPRFADNPLVTGPPHIRFYAGCPLRSSSGHRLGTLCIIDTEPRTLEAGDLQALADLAAMVERELAAVQLATLDELTQIANRRGFMLLAEQSLKLCHRQHTPAALVFLDLNDFKRTNDQWGHAVGDQALQTFALLLKRSCRDSDVLGRLGGDEFALLLPNSPATAAEDLVRRLQDQVDGHNQQTSTFTLSFSHGTVEADPTHPADLETLLCRGDRLMYTHKSSG